jgi:caprin-1
MQNMGNDMIREDFLAGRDGAAKVTQEELGQLDELYPMLAPKREDGALFVKQVK